MEYKLFRIRLTGYILFIHMLMPALGLLTWTCTAECLSAPMWYRTRLIQFSHAASLGSRLLLELLDTSITIAPKAKLTEPLSH